VEPNKREILAEKAQQRLTSAITFQDFVNVVSAKNIFTSFRPAVLLQSGQGKIAFNLMSARVIYSRFNTALMATLYILLLFKRRLHKKENIYIGERGAPREVRFLPPCVITARALFGLRH